MRSDDHHCPWTSHIAQGNLCAFHTFLAHVAGVMVYTLFIVFLTAADSVVHDAK